MNPFFRNSAADENYVSKLVSNPDVVASYRTVAFTPIDYPGGLCDPSQSHAYVIITTTQNGLDYWDTNDSTPYNWESLMNAHNQLYPAKVTVEAINACSGYYNSDPLFNDTQAHIREFCKDAYQDWGTQYVLIGGDGEWIPARDMAYSGEYDVDADIYWSNLDKTFNADHDSLWGEADDNGFDLYSELFIGRLTCDTPQDVSNWMTKSFKYANETDPLVLDNAAFYAGALGYARGDDSVDYSAIKGTDDWLGPRPGSHGQYPAWLGFQYGFETWNQTNQHIPFNLSVRWTAEVGPNPGWKGGTIHASVYGLRDAINNDQVTLLSGVAHADCHMSLDVYDYDWESLYHNTHPFFITDYGCHCGDFDASDDGVLDSMLFRSNTSLAFGCVYNTCYGMGSIDDTNCSSALQQKCFWDYFFDMTNNSGGPENWQLGRAHAFSKDEMAPTINWTWASAAQGWRAVIEGCTLFADPAQVIKAPRETVPPVTTCTLNGTMEGDVYTSNVKVTLNATDDYSGINYTMYQVDNGSFKTYSSPFIISLDGDHTIVYYSVDRAGNIEHWKNVTFTIHKIIQVDIKGGFGITATITNTGTTDLTGVSWDIKPSSMFILGHTSGTVDIPMGGEVKIRAIPFSFGRTTITVRVGDISNSMNSFVLLFFVLGVTSR